MNKTEQYKDQGLRLAVKRKTDVAERLTLPDDFTDRLMLRVEQQKTKPKRRRVWLYPTIAAVAASVLLLFTLHRQPSESPSHTGGIPSPTASKDSKNERNRTRRRKRHQAIPHNKGRKQADASDI